MVIIDHERCGMRCEFESLDEAEQVLRACFRTDVQLEVRVDGAVVWDDEVIGEDWDLARQAEWDELCEDEVVSASGEWTGVDAAGTAEHDECFQKYHGEEWSQYHFAVSDDLASVRVVTPTDETADGIWTLAEILASEGCWPRVEAVAGLMRDAVAQ